MESIFFYIFAIFAVVSAVGVITAKNPVHSAVCLIVCLLQVAALYVLLRVPFLAAVQVFIYVGAVMVLFLFAVLMLDIGQERLKEHIHGQRILAVPAVAVFFIIAGYLIFRSELTGPLGEYSEKMLEKNTEIIDTQQTTGDENGGDEGAMERELKRVSETVCGIANQIFELLVTGASANAEED